MNRLQVEPSAWPNKEIFEDYISAFPTLKKVAEICALIHDIGHGPFSHFVEPFLQWTEKKFRTNEEIGEDVILGKYRAVDSELAPEDAVFLTDELSKISEELGFSLNDFATYVSSDTEFEKKASEMVKGNLFIRKLISSPMDMDRVDFLNRDSYFVGLRGGFDPNAIIQNICLTKYDDQILDLVLEERGIYHAESLLTSRDLMYAIVYHHPVNRWALAALLRSAYILYNDYSYPSELLLRQTDAQLLSLLKQGSKYTKKVADRIEERRPYNRVYELEFSYLNLKNLPNGDEIISRIQELEKEPLTLLELESSVKKNLSSKTRDSEECDVIIDLPPPLKFKEAQIMVKIREQDKPVPLNRVSELARYINERRKERRWFLNVFTNVSNQSSGYHQIIKDIKKELHISLKENPTRIIPGGMY